MVRKSDGSPVKRIRVPGPRVAYSLSDGRVRVLGFHHAEACDVDITTLRVVDRHVLPYGTGARHVGGEVIALLGRRKDIRAVSDISELEPDEPIVLLVGQPDGEAEQPMGTLGWNVLPREIAVLDPDTLTIRRRAPAPPGVVEVLGVARDGNIVVATRRGFVLLNPHTLSLITGYEQAQPISGAVLCAAHNLVALHVEDPPNDGLHAVQWRHKPTR